MNEQIQEVIDKFKIPRPKVTIGESLESAYLIPESELLSLLKLVAEDAYHKIPGMTTKDFEDYWNKIIEKL